MIKRYTMGRVTLAKTDNSSLQGAGIVECERGEFYRCADIDPLLESIGAGGVSGRITNKTLDKHRVEFELWMSDNGRYPQAVSKNLSGRYTFAVAESAWETWKAARSITE